jgi:hypothetical protein
MRWSCRWWPISTIRSRAWKNRVVLSQRAALQSVTLVAVGVYLLFVAAAGYYVRYFGGDWGRSFQLALLFSALLMLVILSFSGSMRAKFRVLVGKHFFSYRYDYREEWLRFTNTLSSQDGFSAMGEHVVKGLADMVESPAGDALGEGSFRSFLCPVRLLEHAGGVGDRRCQSKLCRSCSRVAGSSTSRSIARYRDAMSSLIFRNG